MISIRLSSTCASQLVACGTNSLNIRTVLELDAVAVRFCVSAMMLDYYQKDLRIPALKGSNPSTQGPHRIPGVTAHGSRRRCRVAAKVTTYGSRIIVLVVAIVRCTVNSVPSHTGTGYTERPCLQTSHWCEPISIDS